MYLPDNFIEEYDDFTAYYFSPDFTLGGSNGVEHNFAVVFKLTDMEEATGEEGAAPDLQVMIAPTRVTAKMLKNLQDPWGNNVPELSPSFTAQECVSYGATAHITRWAAGCSFDGTQLPTPSDPEDYDGTVEWIKTHGETLARACAGMIGFALDSPQNRIGETGWDWFLPHVQEGYTSETSWTHRAS